MLAAKAGDDAFTGGAGSDAFFGGEGSDGVYYFFETAGVTVNLATGTGGGAAAGEGRDHAGRLEPARRWRGGIPPPSGARWRMVENYDDGSFTVRDADRSRRFADSTALEAFFAGR